MKKICGIFFVVIFTMLVCRMGGGGAGHVRCGGNGGAIVPFTFRSFDDAGDKWLFV